MTFTDMVSAIQQIQSQLASLSAAAAPAPASTGSAAAFADALSGAAAASPPEVSSTASTDGAVISSGGVTGEDVVQAALKYKGVPYVFGGESSSGMDCSGLVQKTFSDLGISVPRLVHEQQTVGQKVDSLKDARPGDLIVLNGGDHIAIYMGNDTVIHAPYEGRTVSVQKAWFTDKDVVTIRRIVPATGATLSGATASGGASAGTGADVAALSAMLGGSSSSSSLLDSTGSGGTSLSGLLSTLGAGGSSSTAQQLIAARAAIAGGVA